ncbi:hypothetical protein K440DRAFT_552339, partial [Wilcoxina mikolae CBS 423.85]
HPASNLPSEIQYLYTEISAKDRLISEYQETYQSREKSLENHYRQHGTFLKHPKESEYVDQIRKLQNLIIQLQDEKVLLAQNALDLLEKHSLQLDGYMAHLVRNGRMTAESIIPASPPSNLPAESQQMELGRTFGGNRSRSSTTPSISSVLAGESPSERKNLVVDEDGNGDLYCFCRQEAYGSMVACDDKDCPYEWFHWECVNLSETPRGKWYCPACTEGRRR